MNRDTNIQDHAGHEEAEVVMDTTAFEPLEIAEEFDVDKKTPFEKFNITYYRNLVTITIDVMSDVSYGVNINYTKARKVELLVRKVVNLKTPTSESAVMHHFMQLLNNGEYDAEYLRPILEKEVKPKKKRRSPNK